MLWLMMISSYNIYGQREKEKGQRMNTGFDYSNVYELKSVTFWEPTSFFGQGFLDWIEIKSDTDPNISISGTDHTTAWENGSKKDPIAYVSGCYSRVAAEFLITCSSGGSQDFYARASNTDGYIFQAQKLFLNNGVYQYPKTGCSKKFEKEVVRYWEDFELQWQISDNQFGPWIDVETSENYMYVTHKAPIIGTYAPGHIAPTNAQHTLIHLGCKNADGLSMQHGIVDEIYNNGFKFGTGGQNKIYRVDGAGPIRYWGSSSTLCWDVPTMLVNLDGACQGWAAFFEDVVRLQGIATSEMSTVTYNEYVLSSADVAKVNMDAMSFFGAQISNLNALPPDFPGYTGYRSDFLVKNWNVSTSSKFVMNEYTNNYYGITPINITLANGNTISIVVQSGAAGQGNSDPRSEFENHAITKYNGKYYDPSYGSAITSSANDWETPALATFGSMMIYNHQGTIYRINWIGHLNDLSFQSSINP